MHITHPTNSPSANDHETHGKAAPLNTLRSHHAGVPA